MLPLGLGGLLLAAIVGLQQQRFQALQTLATGEQPLATLETQEQQETLRLQLLHKTPSFGYKNLIADWAFLNFLQYFGNTNQRSQVGYGVSPEFFEVIVDKDPYFVTPYLFLSTSTSLYAGAPERAVEMMTRGTAAMTPRSARKGAIGCGAIRASTSYCFWVTVKELSSPLKRRRIGRSSPPSPRRRRWPRPRAKRRPFWPKIRPAEPPRLAPGFR
ncbi:MAG: hypothetical protein HC922_09960 [Leptolyngbyaceae cyanobacterium SM2_3_12]|nr:hypothetical protein [Leptolyngbyaceae cyanobacterium SM2_3_12]